MKSQTFWRLSTAMLGMTSRGVAAVGYFIDDDSCTPAMRDAVGKVLDGTFDMIQAGIDNVGKADKNANGPEQKLIDNLFGVEPEGTNPALSIKSTIQSRLNSLIDLKTNKFTSKDQLTPGVKNNNVKVYCDERRLKVRKANPLQSFDTDVEEVTDTGDCVTNVAYAGQTQKSFAQLQICPKLMQLIITDSAQTTAGLQASFWDKMVTIFVTFTAKVFYQPIDRVQLADKVLLHELTHLNVGGKTDDVGGFFQAYGWKNCMKLGLVTTDKATKGGQNNADSWALYGSVSLLIKTQEKTVEANTGNIVATTSTKKRAIEAVKSVAGRWVKFVA
ncbi:hypothetical protein F4781DRAFT_402528 [Annulohypoxylon bovei var. microspora]|nr:hypothetical protein F4781DRAFT_402528 [Annulohypoxylon bovei var. microspora]